MANLTPKLSLGAGIFQVSTFKTALESEEVTLSLLSHDSQFVGLVYKDGRVAVLCSSVTDCDTDTVQVGDLGTVVVDLCWVHVSEGIQYLVTRTSDNHLHLYTVSTQVPTPGGSTELAVQCQCTCHVNTLTSLLTDAGLDAELESAEYWLLPGSCSHVILRVESCVVTLTWRGSQPPVVETVVHVEGTLSRVTAQLVLALSDADNADLWDLERGRKLATVHVSEFLDEPPLQSLLTESLNYAAFLTAQNNLLTINLNIYFQNHTFPKPDKTQSSESDLSELGAASVVKTKKDISKADQRWRGKLTGISAKPKQPASWVEGAGLGCGEERGLLRSQTTVQESGKKKRVLSGFAQSKMAATISASTEVMAMVDLDLEGSVIDLESLSSSGNKVSLQSKNEEGVLFYHVVDLDTGQASKTRLPSGGVVVTSQCPTFPSLLLTPTELLILAPDLPQEQLVSRLMLYDSAGVADALCRGNGWDRCTIPVHALEVGLRHRQLDTVAFFLKSRENVFVSHDNNPLTPRSTGLSGSPFSSLPKPGDLDLGQVEPAIELLLRTVRENMVDNQSKQFAEHLLHLTLDFLHKVTFNINEQLAKVRAASRSQPAFEAEVKVAMVKVMGYISQLRACVPGMRGAEGWRAVRDDPLNVVSGTVDGGGVVSGALTRGQQKLLKNWRKMSETEAVTDGILSGEVPLLQLHLQTRHGGSQAALSAVVDFGLKKALKFLQQRQLLMAAQIFSNLGFDVWTKLRQVCLYTADRHLRDYLIEELTTDGHLTPHEGQMVRFVQHLESLYSCPSYDLAKILRTDAPPRDWTAAGVDLSALMPPNRSHKMSQQTGEVAASDVVNSETASYSHVVLEWVRGWNEHQQQAIQLDQVINRRDVRLTESISNGVVWRYLLARRDVTRLQRWIDEAFPVLGTTQETRPGSTWPYNLRLTPDMLTAVTDCDPHTRHQVLDYLARRGVLSPQEAADPALLVSRLSRTGLLLEVPHVLETTSRGGLLLPDLHHHLVALCVKHQLPELLYYYLDYWGLCQDATDLTEVGLSVSDLDPWVSTLLHMRSIAGDPTDSTRVYAASLAGSVTMGPAPLPAVTVGDLLDRGLVGRALTTLVYKPEQLHEMVALPEGERGSMPSISQWQSSLSLFPRLQTALCRRLVDGVGDQDISMYNLLQGDAPFDVTYLFGWQSTNTLFCGDSFTKMPHFACPELAGQFGHQMSLTFTHYLRQARPSFAFCALVISLLNAGHKTLSPRRLKAVAMTTHALALRHFSQRPVAAACVAFLEMAGCDTTSLRVCLQAAALIRDHQAAGVDGTAEQRHAVEHQLEKNIAWLLAGCRKRTRRCQLEMLTLLEEAIRWQIEKLSLKSCSPETLALWQLAVQFCQIHDLPPTTGYLADCAKTNDWLMFLTFAHIHNFDKDLVHSELHHFSQRALHEHLHYVVENVTMVPMATDDQRRNDVSMPSRDVRAQLYSRIGLTRHKEKDSTSENDTSEEEAQTDVTLQDESAENTETFELPHDPAEEDVFGILLACDGTRAPARCLTVYAARFRNPVLAVLAACYQDHSTVTCLSSWLVASTTDDAYQAVLDSFDTTCDLRSWTVDDIKTIVLIMTKHDLFKTLLTGLLIFCPDALMVALVRFCVAFHQYEDAEVCRQHLETFKAMHSALIRKSQPQVAPVDDVFSVEWTEVLVHDVLTQTLHTMRSGYNLGRLLRLLDQTNVTRLFSCTVPDFSKLYRLHQMISPAGLTLNYHDLTLTCDPRYEATCQRALEALEERHMYNEARVFAEIAGVSSETITIRQMESELSTLSRSAIWRDAGARCTFWRKCHDAFTRHQVSHRSASQFFQGKLSACSSHKEKGVVCQLAYDWLEVDDQPANQKLKKDLFVQIWMCKIHDYMEKDQKVSDLDSDWMVGEGQQSPPAAQRSELLQYGHIPSEVDALRVNLTVQERSALEALIGQLLDRGKVKDACQVAALVGHYSQDLSIVIACLKLALGHMTVDELSMAMRKLVAAPSPRISRRLSTASFTMVPPASSSMLQSRRYSTASNLLQVPSVMSLSSVEEENVEESPVLDVLRLLSSHVKKGQFCCQRILTIFHISQVLEVTFEWTVLNEEFIILQALLNSDHPERFPLAKDFLATSGLPTSQVAGFLGDTIMKLLNAHNNPATESGATGTWELVDADGAGVGSGAGSASGLLLNLIQLCDDSTRLGHHLHDNIASLTSSNHDMSPQLLSVCVELLVAAHHCFTLSCSMEGIAAVLRSARKLTELLAQSDQFNLLIRLLTGVGRFSEMTYIFDILKEQHQLELLFRKGIEKEEGLRVAILDYIQRVHPSDTDTYKMVSLYFTMYREIAAMLEDTAHRQLNTLKGKPLDSNPEAASILQSVVHYFSDAAESYVKENCMRRAARCVHQARLGALQLHLLSSGQCVINLNKAHVGAFIANHPKFWEAYIVAEAYEDHTHWPTALCKRYIVQNDGKYLTDLRRHVTLTPSLIADVAERYKSEAHRPKWAAAQMRKLLTQCTDILVTYRAAQDLGFTDYSHDLLKGDTSAYLRDSIGIKN